MAASCRHLPSAVVVLLLLGLGPGWGPAPAGAQPDRAVPVPGGDPIENIEQLDLEMLLGTVSAVSRTEESRLKAPAAVTVLDQADIRHSGAITVPDLLRVVPGVQVVRSGPGNFVVSLRGAGGLAGNNLVVLLDGIPMNDRLDGTVEWSGLPVDLHNIERIEIVRGPVSTIYGANAYTGVINIVSAQPPTEVIRGTAQVGVAIDTSGRPLGLASGRVGGQKGRLTWMIAGNTAYDQTFSDNQDTTQPALLNTGGLISLRLALTPDSTLTAEGGATFQQRSSLSHLVLESQEKANARSFAQLRYAVRNLPSILDSIDLWTRLRWLAVNDEGRPYHGLSPGTVRGLDGEAGLDVRFDLPWKLSAAVGANAGLLRVDASFLHPRENARWRPSYGFYGSAGADLFHRLALSMALRGDVSSMMRGAQWSYRGSAVYYASTYALRLAAGSAYREPTYAEAGSRFIDPSSMLILLEGNPGLSPPRLDSVELGVLLMMFSRLTLSAAVYFERLSSLIVEDFSPLVRKTFRNDPEDHLLVGGELEAEWRIRPHLSVLLSLSGMWSLTGANDSADTLGAPAHNSSITAWSGLRGAFLGNRLGASLGAGYTSARAYSLQAGVPPQILDVQVPHLFRLEAAADYQPSRRVPVRMSFKLQSVLPDQAVESPLPGAGLLGTSVFLGVEYRAD